MALSRPKAKPMNAPTSSRTLADLRPGESGIVKELHSTGLQRRRMMDLGIVPGTVISAEMRSPLGDPVAYRVRGAMVALRREQAQLVDLEADRTEENET
jgi:Fe2+ transport system protein FeoA